MYSKFRQPQIKIIVQLKGKRIVRKSGNIENTCTHNKNYTEKIYSNDIKKLVASVKKGDDAYKCQYEKNT